MREKKGRVDGLLRNGPGPSDYVWGDVVGLILRSNEEEAFAAAGIVALGNPGLCPAPVVGSDQCEGVVTACPDADLSRSCSGQRRRRGPGFDIPGSNHGQPPHRIRSDGGVARPVRIQSPQMVLW